MANNGILYQMLNTSKPCKYSNNITCNHWRQWHYDHAYGILIDVSHACTNNTSVILTAQARAEARYAFYMKIHSAGCCLTKGFINSLTKGKRFPFRSNLKNDSFSIRDVGPQCVNVECNPISQEVIMRQADSPHRSWGAPSSSRRSSIHRAYVVLWHSFKD